jgi:hypothetical protein
MLSPSARPPEPPTSDDRLLWDIWLSFLHFPLLIAADEVGLFSLLGHAPATATEVASTLALSLRSAAALLGPLTALGLLVQRQGRFYLTDTARTYLLPDSPYYYGGLLHPYRDFPVTARALLAALQKDKPHTEHDYGDIAQTWASGELSVDLAGVLTAEMHSLGFPAAVGMARCGHFTSVQRLLDVGGGSGCFSIALAQRYPALRCTVLDLPPVCALANQYIDRYALQDRIDTYAANMFIDVWPSGCDGILFSNIFHDWDRTSCLHLARRSFEALPPGGHLYLHEILLADTKDGPLVAATFSLLMLFALRGQQFTTGELAGLLGEAGFTEITVAPSYAYYSLISARKP